MQNIIIGLIVFTTFLVVLSMFYTVFQLRSQNGSPKTGMLFILVSILMLGAFIYLGMDDFGSSPTPIKVASSETKEAATEPIVEKTDERVPGTLGVTPEEFRIKYNEAVRKMGSSEEVIIEDFPVYEGLTQNNAKHFFSDALGIFSLVNKLDGTMRDVTLIFMEQGPLSKLNFVEASAAMIEVFGPELPPDDVFEMIVALGMETFMDADYNYENMNGSIEKEGYVYSTFYDPALGTIFTISSTDDVGSPHDGTDMQEMVDTAQEENHVEEAAQMQLEDTDMFRNSRYQFELDDANGQSSRVLVVPIQETSEIMKEFGAAGANKGDTEYNGTYELVLFKEGEITPVHRMPLQFGTSMVDGSPIAEGRFILERKMNYVIPGDDVAADVLVIEQYGSSNGNEHFVFRIQDDKIQPIPYIDGTLFSGKPLIYVGDNQYRSQYYNNHDGEWYMDTFLLDDGTNSMMLIDSSVLDPEWLYAPIDLN